MIRGEDGAIPSEASDHDGPGTLPPPTPRGPQPRGAQEPPLYRGEPLDSARGPGLGCFWIQVVLLAILVVLTPIAAMNAWPTWLTAGMLIASLVVLLFVGQTLIFLLRIVAADRRSRRSPLAAGSPTVGQLEAAQERAEEEARDQAREQSVEGTPARPDGEATDQSGREAWEIAGEAADDDAGAADVTGGASEVVGWPADDHGGPADIAGGGEGRPPGVRQ